MDNHDLFLAMDISLAAIVPHKEAAIALAADRLAETTGMAYGGVKDALAVLEPVLVHAVEQVVGSDHPWADP